MSDFLPATGLWDLSSSVSLRRRWRSPAQRKWTCASPFPSKPEKSFANWHCFGIERNAGLVAIRFRHDRARVAVPKSDLRPRILRRNRRKPAARTFQILKTLQFKVPAVGVADQYVVDGISGRNKLSPHNAASGQVVTPHGDSFQSASRYWSGELRHVASRFPCLPRSRDGSQCSPSRSTRPFKITCS